MNPERFLGIPFVKGGRDEKVGLDCWGLLVVFYREVYGIKLPLYPMPSGSLTDRNLVVPAELDSEQWENIGDPIAGDVVAMGSVARGISHVGVWLFDRAPLVLHSHTNRSVIQPLDDLRRQFNLVSFFRHASHPSLQ